MKKIIDNLPLIAASVVLLVVLSLSTVIALRANDGNFAYTLDDAYIHMAIAKNVVSHGVFGVTRDGFSSSTSSPLWTLLLALVYGLCGINDWAPGVLAAIFAFGALYATDSLARVYGVGGRGRFLTLLGVVFFTPLVPLVSSGMEHAMHVFFIIALVRATVVAVRDPRSGNLGRLFVCGLMATGTRYESIFLVAPLALVLVFMKRRDAAILVVAAAAIPIIGYGVFSHLSGSDFLPNSLMLKGNFPTANGITALIEALGGRSCRVLYDTPHLLSAAVLLLLGASRPGRPAMLRFLALSLVCSMMAHLQFAGVGWFYRYEAYLVAVSLPVIAALYLPELRRPQGRALAFDYTAAGVAEAAFVGLLLLPLLGRAAKSLADVAKASNHIYSQQIQMARFIKQEYPPGVRVALHDLGAIAFYTDASIVDLWGLGTIEVARAKRRQTFDSSMIDQLLSERQIDLVVVYSDWFQGQQSLPPNFIPVADWTKGGNYYCKTVTFYAPSEDRARELAERLARYERGLPRSVQVVYRVNGQSVREEGL